MGDAPFIGPGNDAQFMESNGAVTRVRRLNGILSLSYDNGATWGPITGSGLEALAQHNMQRYLAPGRAQTWAWWRQFQGLGSDCVIANGGGGPIGTNAAIADTTDPIAGLGGIRKLTTGTATDGSARMAFPDFTILVPTIAYADPTKKFYRMHRAALITAPNVNTILRLGSFNWAAGVHGTGSTTKYTCRLAGTAVYLVSTVSIDTAWHVFEHWYDGASAWFSVDGEDPIGVPASGMWPLNTGQSFGEMSIAKNPPGDAVDHQCYQSFGFWGGTLP